jgi:RNA polymerase sigma-70 factor (ECF subfamily)
MSDSSDSDEEILRHIRRSDERAFEELLRRYRERLAQYAYSILKCHGLAEDAVWSVFHKIWRRRETLLVNSSVQGYLYGAVSNESISIQKSVSRHPWVGLDQAPAASLLDPDRPESAMLYRELTDEIDAMLRCLPPRRRLIFQMHRLEGLRYGQIAEKLGLSERTVQNHMVEAVKQLIQGREKLRAKFERSSNEAAP